MKHTSSELNINYTPLHASPDNTFFDHILPVSYHLRLFGLAYPSTSPSWKSKLHIGILIALYLATIIRNIITHVPVIFIIAWILPLIVYLQLVFLTQKISSSHSSVLQEVMDNPEEAKKLKIGIIMGVVVMWIFSFVLLGWAVYLGIKRQDLNTSSLKALTILKGIAWMGIVMLGSLQVIVYYLILYLHELDCKKFTKILQNRTIVPQSSSALKLDMEERESVDSILKVYHDMRTSLKNTYNVCKFVLVVVVIVLTVIFLFGLYSLIKGNEANALWTFGSPAILILLLYPVLRINMVWEDYLFEITDWSKYEIEERTFLMYFLASHPIEFAIFGFVLSRQIAASLVGAALAAGLSVVGATLLEEVHNHDHFHWD